MKLLIEKSYKRVNDLLILNSYKNYLSLIKRDYHNSNFISNLNCKIHGEFRGIPVQYAKPGSMCPKCKKIKSNIESMRKYISKSIIKYKGEYDYSLIPLDGSIDWYHERVPIICSKHGVFYQKIYNHYKYNKCKKCSPSYSTLLEKYTREDIIDKLNKLHNFKYLYDDTIFNKSSDKISIKCKKHGIFHQRYSSHLNGNGCPNCHLENKSKDKDKFILDAIKIHGYKYNYSKVSYKNNKTKVIIKCPVHGDFKCTPNSHISMRTGCPKCRESTGERYISGILDDLGLSYIKEYKIKGYNYRYDFFIKELSLYIEVNGIQHYKPVERFGGEQSFLNCSFRDSEKERLVIENDGILMVIKYNELYNDFNIIKEMNYLISSKYFLVLKDTLENKIITFKTIGDFNNFFNVDSKTDYKDVLDREYISSRYKKFILNYNIRKINRFVS